MSKYMDMQKREDIYTWSLKGVISDDDLIL